MIYLTFPSKEEAIKVGSQLMNQKLIACFNLLDADSNYVWKGTLCKEHEIIAIMKTDTSMATKVEEAIVSLHSYEVPCILQWKVNANISYAQWIQSCLNL